MGSHVDRRDRQPDLTPEAGWRDERTPRVQLNRPLAVKNHSDASQST